ncbi:MAG: metallophosphoesterase [Clostridiales bacterium]|nr:metallophosphoesterase [Clostridiales bacterium]
MKMMKKRRHTGFIILLLLIMLILLMLLDSNTRVTVDEYPLGYSSLPAAFDGYRIVQLSDIHAAVFGKDNSRLIDAVRKAQPDIITVTGDLVSNIDDMDEALGIVQPLIRSLVNIAPVYYVTGNHEWDSGWVRELLKMLVDSGVTVLKNEYVRLSIGKASIVLAGIDDPNGPADMIPPEAFISQLRMVEGDTFLVLLAHRNIYLNKLSGQGIDLILCGHAHGGLIRLPLAGGLLGPSRELFPPYTSGVYTKGGTKMLVSRGIGNKTGVPRFLNNPQVAVAVLKKA